MIVIYTSARPIASAFSLLHVVTEIYFSYSFCKLSSEVQAQQTKYSLPFMVLATSTEKLAFTSF